jgi:dihydroorotase-like cyclic amidohydrolase
VQIYTHGHIANQLGCPLYPVYISSAQSVDTIATLKAQGFPIVGETLAYFLSTTAPEMGAKGADAKGKIQPPIRFEKDRERLWRGIKDGTLSVVGTDSLTYSARFKASGDFWDCRVGVNMQVADTLALLFDEAINHRGVDLLTLARSTLRKRSENIWYLSKKRGRGCRIRRRLGCDRQECHDRRAFDLSAFTQGIVGAFAVASTTKCQFDIRVAEPR